MKSPTTLTAVLLSLSLGSAVFCQAAEKSKLVTNLEAGKKQVVVLYGTSLTAGGGWVAELVHALQGRYPGLATVINSGGSGKWSDWGLKNLDKRVLEKNPDTVFIEFCINDAVARFQGSVDIARANLEEMIRRIVEKNPRCEVVLMTMTPGDRYPPEHRSYRKDIAAYYSMYRTVATARGLLLIDLYPKWLALQRTNRALFDRYVPDSIHPTNEGCSAVVTPTILEGLGLRISEDD